MPTKELPPLAHTIGTMRESVFVDGPWHKLIKPFEHFQHMYLCDDAPRGMKSHKERSADDLNDPDGCYSADRIVCLSDDTIFVVYLWIPIGLII